MKSVDVAVIAESIYFFPIFLSEKVPPKSEFYPKTEIRLPGNSLD